MAAALERLQKTARDNPLAAVAAAATAAVAAPAVARGLKLTTAFLASLRTSKRHGRIDGYNDLHNKDEADDRNDQYADLVDSYYDLATEFYEWGWGACFHFADRRGRETFAQSLLRHEYYLASRLALKAGDCVLDCGLPEEAPQLAVESSGPECGTKRDGDEADEAPGAAAAGRCRPQQHLAPEHRHRPLRPLRLHRAGV